jgi:1-acyl-sn-glycerol-3-phosphate acyltransferase
MRTCEGGARYDAIHVRGWSSIITGALLTPLRLFVAISIVLI